MILKDNDFKGRRKTVLQRLVFLLIRNCYLNVHVIFKHHMRPFFSLSLSFILFLFLVLTPVVKRIYASLGFNCHVNDDEVIAAARTQNM